MTVLEAAPVPLANIIGARLGAELVRIHRDHGVDVAHRRHGRRQLHTTAEGVVVDCADGGRLEADAVLIGIGIVPNTAVAAASGLQVRDGIVVDAQGRTSTPHIYAAGDVAQRYSASGPDGHVRFEHFDNANQQGAAVANAMLGRDAVNDDAPWFWSDQYDHNLQFLGEAAAELVIRGNPVANDFTAFYLDGGLLRGVFTADQGKT